jgi:hypothetical protein
VSRSAVLLDTRAVIWLANGDYLARSATTAILHAGAADGIFVSPVSAWEVGLLSKPKAGRKGTILRSRVTIGTPRWRALMCIE